LWLVIGQVELDQYLQSLDEKTFGNSSIEKDDFTILIPVLNEQDAIKKVIDSIKQEGYKKIIVIDGYSSDKTVEVVENENIPVIYQNGVGKTGALITGFEQVSTPYVVLIDGDCTYDPKDIEKLSPSINDHELVIGARSSGRANIPLFNRFGNFAINILFNYVFSTSLKDVCSGLYLLKTDFAKSLDLNTRGFDVEVEVAALASLSTEIAELPISYHDRIGTQKLEPLKDGYKIIKTILKLGLKYRKNRVAGLFAALGILSMGAIILIYNLFLT
jgi:dolichol-phosphate mannosyltransferase